jgi:2-polyprenyl-3-methyl-5-hydroxy-6-metoxy-1,4-benzoquinol methylase
MAKARQSKLMQSLFEQPIEVNGFPVMGQFEDEKGRNIPLYSGLRSKIKPGWETMVRSNFKSQLPQDEGFVRRKVEDARVLSGKLLESLTAFGFSLGESHCLEVGCHAGALSYQLAELGAESVTGTEFSGYKIQSVDGSQEVGMETVNEELAILRGKVAAHFGNARKVVFRDDDICSSLLPDNSYHMLCSWDVLEHLSDPAGAFRHMARILKPGGLAYHDYNPFFSLNGGHSLCTLDFPWGHARLSDADFHRYVQLLRPAEAEPASHFYRQGLNRMSQADLRHYAGQAGLQVVAFVPFVREQHYRMINQDILKQSREQFPGLEVMDLVCPRVVVILKKPE